MSLHLLSLAALHEADQRVIGVIFGPDGNFEGAPRFLGPVWDPLFEGWDHVHPTEWADPNDPPDEVRRMWLDCRVPSVAARLAGLCARALDATAQQSAWFGHSAGLAHNPTYVLRWAAEDGHERSVGWDLKSGRPFPACVTGKWSWLPTLPPDMPAAMALAALTMIAAPRIAALGGA